MKSLATHLDMNLRMNQEFSNQSLQKTASQPSLGQSRQDIRIDLIHISSQIAKKQIAELHGSSFPSVGQGGQPFNLIQDNQSPPQQGKNFFLISGNKFENNHREVIINPVGSSNIQFKLDSKNKIDVLSTNNRPLPSNEFQNLNIDQHNKSKISPDNNLFSGLYDHKEKQINIFLLQKRVSHPNTFFKMKDQQNGNAFDQQKSLRTNFILNSPQINKRNKHDFSLTNSQNIYKSSEILFTGDDEDIKIGKRVDTQLNYLMTGKNNFYDKKDTIFNRTLLPQKQYNFQSIPLSPRGIEKRKSSGGIEFDKQNSLSSIKPLPKFQSTTSNQFINNSLVHQIMGFNAHDEENQKILYGSLKQSPNSRNPPNKRAMSQEYRKYLKDRTEQIHKNPEKYIEYSQVTSTQYFSKPQQSEINNQHQNSIKNSDDQQIGEIKTKQKNLESTSSSAMSSGYHQFYRDFEILHKLASQQHENRIQMAEIVKKNDPSNISSFPFEKKIIHPKLANLVTTGIGNRIESRNEGQKKKFETIASQQDVTDLNSYRKRINTQNDLTDNEQQRIMQDPFVIKRFEEDMKFKNLQKYYGQKYEEKLKRIDLKEQIMSLNMKSEPTEILDGMDSQTNYFSQYKQQRGAYIQNQQQQPQVVPIDLNPWEFEGDDLDESIKEDGLLYYNTSENFLHNINGNQQNNAIY